MRISAKSGLNVGAVLDAVCERIPPPDGDPAAPPRALIMDSVYDQYRGVIAFVRVVDGAFRRGQAIRSMATGERFEVEEIGVFAPAMAPTGELGAGEVGYVITGVKDVGEIRVGDTFTDDDRPADEALPGYQDVKPMVFAGLFPTDGEDYGDLRDALAKLKLNDASLVYEPETSQALGFGFRCGFLGLLHMEVIRERLEREFDLDLLATTPNVAYQVTTTAGEVVEVRNPSQMPDAGRIEHVEEPYVKASVIVPKEYVGTVMELCQDRRGVFDHMEYLSETRVSLIYALPLAEIVLDFYDQLKSRTRGYASFDYELAGDRASNLAKVDILLDGRARRRPEPDRAPRQGVRGGAGAGGAAALDHPAPDVRRAGAGRDRLPRDRARDDQGQAQGRHVEVLRRRHLAQAQAAGEAEEGQEADEAGRHGRGAPGGVPRRAVARRVVGRRAG